MHSNLFLILRIEISQERFKGQLSYADIAMSIGVRLKRISILPSPKQNYYELEDFLAPISILHPLAIN